MLLQSPSLFDKDGMTQYTLFLLFIGGFFSV